MCYNLDVQFFYLNIYFTNIFYNEIDTFRKTSEVYVKINKN